MTEYVVCIGDEQAEPFAALAALAKVAKHAEVREQVVRCRDCAHYSERTGYCYAHAYEVTRFTEYDEEVTEDEGAIAMDADGFCSLGARREVRDD